MQGGREGGDEDWFLGFQFFFVFPNRVIIFFLPLGVREGGE